LGRGPSKSALATVEVEAQDGTLKGLQAGGGGSDRLTKIFLLRSQSADAGDLPPHGPMSSTESTATEASSAAGSTLATANKAQAATAESTIRYRVKFLNPQVNLVCPNAQGTVLVAAKGASLVGRDLGTFYCCPSAAAMDSPTGTTAPTTHGRVAAVVHRRFEKLLRIEQALAFAARLDGCHQGIPWTSNGGLGGLGGLGSGLNQVMKPFDVRVANEAMLPVTRRDFALAAAQLAQLAQLSTSAPPLQPAAFVPSPPPVVRVGSLEERVSCDLSRLSLTLDPEEFELLGDAVTHLLLAPPYEPPPVSEQRASPPPSGGAAAAAEGGGNLPSPRTGYRVVDLERLRAAGLNLSGLKPNSKSKAKRASLKAAVDYLEEAGYGVRAKRGGQDLGSDGSAVEVVRVIEVRLGEALSVLKASQDASLKDRTGRKLDEVEIGLSGVTGSLSFLRDSTNESVLRVESIWINNERPGPQSLSFSDPTVVLKPKRLGGLPVCQRCFAAFEPESNAPCRSHANAWGEDGLYGPGLQGGFKRRPPSRSAASLCSGAPPGGPPGGPGDSYSCWTCCGSPDFRAPPCCDSRRHNSGQHMVQVRAVGTKPLLVGGEVVQVFKELQVSLFPGSKTPLEVQLTADMAHFLSGYLFPDSSKGGEKGGEASGSAAAGHDRPAKAALFGLSTGKPPTNPGGEKEEAESSSSEEEDEQGPVGSEDKGGKKRGKFVYLKYCHFSQVALELTTVGFGKRYGVQLDRERLPLQAPSYHRSERLISWHLLGQKYWRHVAKNLPFSRRDPAGADQASDAAAMAQAASFRASGGMGALQMGKELMGLQKGNAPVLTGPGAPKAKEKNSKTSKAQSLLFGSRKP